MPFLTMRQAALSLGVAPQTLAQYYHAGKLTGQPVGPDIILVDPAVAKEELAAAGFYVRRQMRRNRKRSALAAG